MRSVAIGAFELVRETFRFDCEFDIEYEYDFRETIVCLAPSQIGWFLILIPPHIMYSNRVFWSSKFVKIFVSYPFIVRCNLH